MIRRRPAHIAGLFLLLAAGLVGCATTAGTTDRDKVVVAPGVSTDRLLRAAAAAGARMNYSVKQGDNHLLMEKNLPLGSGYFVPNPAKHRNRIAVSVVPGAAGGSPEVLVEGEYLGDPRDQDIRNCVPCDVNRIKKALRETR